MEFFLWFIISGQILHENVKKMQLINNKSHVESCYYTVHNFRKSFFKSNEPRYLSLPLLKKNCLPLGGPLCIINKFFVWRKNHASFPKYLDFCVFVTSAKFKIWDVLFWVLSTIEIKFCQILDISNMFSAQCWKLETSFRPFYEFTKTTI